MPIKCWEQRKNDQLSVINCCEGRTKRGETASKISLLLAHTRCSTLALATSRILPRTLPTAGLIWYYSLSDLDLRLDLQILDILDLVKFTSPYLGLWTLRNHRFGLSWFYLSTLTVRTQLYICKVRVKYYRRTICLIGNCMTESLLGWILPSDPWSIATPFTEVVLLCLEW